MDLALHNLYSIARIVVAAAFFASCLVALTYWAVRKSKLNAWSPPARLVRSVAEPVIKPLERRVIRLGGNPIDAPVWLVGIVVVTGLVVLGLLGWAVGMIGYVRAMSHGGSRAWLTLLLDALYFLLITGLIIRVIGSWFGMGRYHRWVRYSYNLTDWLVEPIRRLLPPFGMFDVSPIVAYFILWVARTLLGRLVG